jgi:hypothetical protein
MSKEIDAGGQESGPTWETLEAFTRAQVQALIQRLLEKEVTELPGSAKSQRRVFLYGKVLDDERRRRNRPESIGSIRGTRCKCTGR